jgi:phospholipid/cholesterol/gamma-HCH transport system substrate-binding protein
MRASPAVRIVALAVILTAVVAVGMLFFGGDGGYTITARFVNAGQLVNGNQVEVGGVPAGSVEDIEITDDGQADVTFKVSDEVAPLPMGTRAVVKQRSLSGIANRFIDLELGNGGRDTIADGGRIEPDDTDTAVELDELFDLFDPVARVAVQDLLEGSRKMIEGQGQELNRGVEYLNPALSTSRRLFGELAKDEVLLRDFLGDSSTLVGALAQRRSDLTGAVRNLNTTFNALRTEKDALAESIDRLPPFMRRANSTFVNLRTTLDDVDPLVDASEPVARRLAPFLAQARGLAADARPTVRDLSRTVRRPGAANDLIEFFASFPPRARTALETRQINGARRRGAFPETARSLRDFAPTVAFGRPYTQDFVGWLEDFSTTGAFDALGAFSRASVNFDELLAGGVPQRQGQFRRCPGGADVAAADGSNVLSAEEREALDCRESDRAVAGP